LRWDPDHSDSPNVALRVRSRVSPFRSTLFLLAALAPWLQADERPPPHKPVASSDIVDQAASDAVVQRDLDLESDEELLPEWGRGPFELRDPYLLALPRLSPWMRSPEVLEPGHVEIRLGGVWANSWALEERFVVDGEARVVLGSVRLGIAPRIELGVGLPWEWRGGGLMDRRIDAFHERLGFGQLRRDERPRDRYLVAGTERDGSPFDHDGEGDGVGDLVPEARVLLLRGGEWLPALTATVRLRIPTAAGALRTSRRVDASVALDASKRLGPVVLYLTAAYTYCSESRLDGVELERHRVFGGVGVEVELSDWIALVAQLQVETPREANLHDLPRPICYVVFGVKLSPVEGLTIDLGAIENVVDLEASADFGVLATVSFRF
jgi:hypothetical protein